MNSFSTLLASFSPDNLRRGKQFEIACKWFLENDRLYSSIIEKVWLWEEWPERWGRDCGIDLIAKGKDGKTWAIQAKCYDPEYHVTKKDVDSFLSESTNNKIDLRLLVTSTDNIGRNAQAVIARQNVSHPVRAVLRQDLVAADLTWPTNFGQITAGYKPKQAKYEPRLHQEEAIQEVASRLDRRGQLIMASGTGKTLTALWIAEKLGADRVLVLLPSLLLLSKTLQEWVNRAAEPFAFLPVCSDETAARGADEIMSSTSELAFPSTTDSKEIAAFLGQAGKRVIFSTYQSSPRIAEAFAQLDLSSFDLVIADEAHRCAGKISSEYATVLDEASIPSEKRLFMTATPRVYVPHLMKRAADSGVDVASMDDESVFGPVLHRLTFGQAIDRELLTDYQVVIVGVDRPSYMHLVSNRRLVETDTGIKSDARTLASQVGLAKSIARYDLRRVITFHSRINWAKKFANELSEVIDWMPDGSRPNGSISCRFVSGKMPTGERNKYLSALSEVGEGERYVLANARCLAEGVDVPALDGIAFIDPKKSEIDIVQAVGRAIRLSDDKSVGTIVIPVFIEKDDDPEITLSSSEFGKVWKVVNALRAHDSQLGEQLDTLRTELGRSNSSGRPDKIIFDLPANIDIKFVSAFNTRLIESTTSSWDFWFGLIGKYAEENRHARVPVTFKTAEGSKLGAWCHSQRNKRDELSKERVARLESLPGWVWSQFAAQWEEGYAQLQVFAAHEGHARPPQGFKTVEGLSLGTWVGTQRANRDQLSVEQTTKLELLQGWVWDIAAFQLEQAFVHLQKFVEREGHARVPNRFRTAEGFALGTWVQNKRKAKDSLSVELIARLESFPGWAWNKYAAQWEDKFSHLQSFVEREGHARVPKRFRTDEGFRLGEWVGFQRSTRAKLSEEQIARLESQPGWIGDPLEFWWDAGFAHLKAFVEREGHARPPNSFETAEGYPLGTWCGTQRQKRDQLLEERVARLESLPGWVWDLLAFQWDEGYSGLQVFVEREGHSRVPWDFETAEGLALGNWVGNQRRAKDKLSEERVARLESLPGWVWNLYSIERWEEGYAYLQSFVEREGHANVLQKFRTAEGYALGQWCGIQRLKRDQLSEERVARLESLHGWVWDKFAALWEGGYAHLHDFVEREGHAKVPRSFETAEGFRLGSWVATQRTKKRREKLSNDQVKRLEALPGWVWGTIPRY